MARRRKKRSLFRRLFQRKEKKPVRTVSNTGIEFEEEMCNVLRTNGYKNVKMTSTTGDFGIDILAEKGGFTYGIQCKYYSGKVGIEAVQQAYAGCSYYGTDRAVILTNNLLTANAEKLAKKLNVAIWDAEWVREHTENKPDKPYKNQIRTFMRLLFLIAVIAVMCGIAYTKFIA